MMERWPFRATLVLVCFLMMWHDGETQTGSAFTIDWVKLTLLPGPTVESGTNLTLRCEVKVSHSLSQVIYFLRFLMDGNVIYSKNTSEAVLQYSLIPARAAHSGFYTCQVKIQKKEKSSNELYLSVTGLQTPQLRVNPSIVNEGDQINATCSSPEESGGLIISFYKNNQILKFFRSKDNSGTISVKAEESGNITLHCSYSLMLHPSAGQSSISNTVHISVKELDITPSIRISPRAVAVEGDRMHISCTVSAYSSGLEIFLIKDTVLYENSVSFRHSFVASADDSGEYVCKSERGNVQKSSKAKLEVVELFSKPILSMTPKNVFQGQHFSLSCRSLNTYVKQIASTDMKYSLYKDNKRLTNKHIYSTSATRDSSGSYYCEATAKNITKVSMPLYIQVKVPVSVPVIRTVGKMIIGQPFQLQCESEHGTLPINYTLLKLQEPVAHMTVIGPRRSALFNISAINYRNESRSFICLAENQGPRQYSSSLNTPVIETVSIPDLTLNSKGNMVSEGTNLTLYCSVQRGTVPITFIWYRKGVVKPLRIARNSSTKGFHIINSITRDAEGRYYCQASNDANETRTSVAIHIGVNFAIWKKAVIGVSCIFLLVLIIVILVIFLKKAHTPRKTKRAVELSVKPVRTKSSDPMRVSLTLDFEDNTAGNVSPCIMGRNAWSEHVSSSESDEESEKEESEKSQHSDKLPIQNVDSGGELVTHNADIVKGDFQDIKQDETDQMDVNEAGYVNQPTMHNTHTTDMYVQMNNCELEPEKVPSSPDTPHVIYAASIPAPPACQ